MMIQTGLVAIPKEMVVAVVTAAVAAAAAGQ